MKFSRKQIYFGMVMTTLFWAGAFIGGKVSTPYIPSFTLTFLRFFFAILILTLIKESKVKKEGIRWRLEKKHIPVFLFTGIVGLFGYHVLFFQSLHYTTATNAGIINGMNPIATTILSALFLKEFLKRKQVIGVIISFVGVVGTITNMDIAVLTSLKFNQGDLIMLCAMVCWASYGVFSKGKGKGIPPLELTYFSFLTCLIFSIPFVLWEKPWTFLGQVPMIGWMGVIYMSIFPSVIGYLFQQVSIKHIGPTQTAIFINLVPIFSMTLAILLLGEAFIPIKVISAAMTITGVIICQRGGRHEFIREKC